MVYVPTALASVNRTRTPFPLKLQPLAIKSENEKQEELPVTLSCASLKVNGPATIGVHCQVLSGREDGGHLEREAVWGGVCIVKRANKRRRSLRNGHHKDASQNKRHHRDGPSFIVRTQQGGAHFGGPVPPVPPRPQRREGTICLLLLMCLNIAAGKSTSGRISICDDLECIRGGSGFGKIINVNSVILVYAVHLGFP